MKSYFYLSHPFASRKKVRKWELEFEKEHGIVLLNPFYDGPEREDVENVDKKKLKDTDYEKRLNAAQIVVKDLKEILGSDGLVCVIDGNYSVGTHQEMVYAKMFNKLVYTICTDGHHNHPWIVHHSDKVFRSFKSFGEFVTKTRVLVVEGVLQKEVCKNHIVNGV